MKLKVILSFCAFFLPFPSDVFPDFLHHFLEIKIDLVGFKKILEIKLLDESIVSEKG